MSDDDSSATSAMNSVAEASDIDRESNEGSDDSQLASDDQKSLLRKARRPVREGRWRYLRRFYNDDYLELLRVESGSRNDRNETETIDDEGLTYSQNGAVIWTAQEKANLFHALAKRGRFDLPGLAAQVGSKSVVEIQMYLQQLKAGLVDAHLFNPRHMGVPMGEIPAAVEIDLKTENLLEKAADALCMYQERYEEAAGEKKHGNLWLTSLESAKIREKERAENSEGVLRADDEYDEELDAEIFFSLPTMLELSEKVFMNRSNPSAEDNWRNLNAWKERPAVTFDFLREIYEITVNLTRKLMQTSIFIAMSRLRASKYNSYAPSKLVKPQDVQGAIRLLGLQKESWGFWQNTARRCGLQVVQATHGRGLRKRVMSYDSVERAMSERAVKRRGRRQSRSSSDDSSVLGYSTDTTSEAIDSEQEEMSSTSSARSTRLLEDGIDGPGRADELTEGEETDQGEAQHLYLESLARTLLQPSTSAKRKYKEFQEEIRQEAYASRLDEAASCAEQERLLKMFDTDFEPSEAQLEKDVVNPRPKVLRKTRDELVDWTDTFSRRHSWEDHTTPVPEELFSKTRDEKRLLRPISSNESESSALEMDLSQEG